MDQKDIRVIKEPKVIKVISVIHHVDHKGHKVTHLEVVKELLILDQQDQEVLHSKGLEVLRHQMVKKDIKVLRDVKVIKVTLERHREVVQDHKEMDLEVVKELLIQDQQDQEVLHSKVIRDQLQVTEQKVIRVIKELKVTKVISVIKDLKVHHQKDQKVRKELKVLDNQDQKV